MRRSKTGIFLAQFAGDVAPFNRLGAFASGRRSSAIKGVQISLLGWTTNLI